MSRASSAHGVRRILVDNFGAGSITVDQAPRPDIVEARSSAADENFLAIGTRAPGT